MRGQPETVLFGFFSTNVTAYEQCEVLFAFQEQVTVGLLTGSAGSSTSRTPAVTDQSFIVLSGVFDQIGGLCFFLTVRDKRTCIGRNKVHVSFSTCFTTGKRSKRQKPNQCRFRSNPPLLHASKSNWNIATIFQIHSAVQRMSFQFIP